MGALKLSTAGGGANVLNPTSTASDTTITTPAVTGNMLVSTAVSSSTTNTVTNKVAVSIGGVTYYLLASTSGA